VKRTAGIIAICVLAAIAVLAIPAFGREGLPGYAGIKVCNMCHQRTHAEIVKAQPGTPHACALWAVSAHGGDLKLVGDFSTAPGFKQGDVAYVLGKGERYQAYLSKDLKALPGEWDVHDKKWAPLAAEDARKSCLGCHTTGYDAAAGQWSDAGVSCEACHGPGADHMKSKDKLASIVRPKQLAPERQAMTCGRCHARGKDADGLPFAAGFMPGEDLSQKFTLDAETELGARYTQYNDLVRSKHLAQGVTCTTCHEPHGVGAQAHQLRKPADELCAGCHPAANLTGAQHAAAKDCVRCHMPKGSHRFEKPQG